MAGGCGPGVPARGFTIGIAEEDRPRRRCALTALVLTAGLFPGFRPRKSYKHLSLFPDGRRLRF